MDGRFTDEELAIAKRVDLCAVAESLGYTVKRIGKYHTLKEMDSIRIYNRSHWYRWSRQFDKGNNGGSQIDFLRVFCGMSVKEAVFWLLDFAGYSRIEIRVKPFKCDVTGNDKNYGFNVVNENSTELVVFEAAIDLMSYVDIFADYESNKLALGMLADAPLETFLREHPQITSIRFCLDGDEPGRKAAAELMRKYYELGYEVEDCPPPAGYKDYNEWLVAAKLNLNRMNKRADEPVRA